jgi:NADPH:quinone reductase-like Zn-dependent oxidoreductase
MKALIFDRFGEPTEVLQLKEVPTPQAGPGEVRVRMLASPINPSDLLVVRGRYGRVPSLPATPGFEGVGRVEAAGSGLLGRLRLGRRVAVLNGAGGNWQEMVILPARQVVPVPAELPDDQAAVFFVNPASALIMTRYLLKVPAGAWLLQTAAFSALGRMVIRLGRHYAFRTINVVRRPEQVADLLQLGGDAVICTHDESMQARVQGLTGGTGVPYALDAVGGTTGAEVVRCLAQKGRLVVYGTLSGEPIPVDPRHLMVGNQQIEGFWLSQWMREQRILTLLGLFRRIGRLLTAGVLTSPIAASFALADYRTALQRAETAGRDGKILLRMDAVG